MANLVQMMKQAASMRKELKQMQRDLSRRTVEFASGGVSVVASGDMSVKSIQIDAAMLEGAKADDLARQVVTAVNGALSAAKKQAGSEMSKLTGALGLPGMLE